MLLSLCMLAAMGILGIATLRRVMRSLTPLEQLAYGFPLGVVGASLVLVPFAKVLGLSATLAGVSGVICAIVIPIVWPGVGSMRRPQWSVIQAYARARTRGQFLPALLIGAFVLRWAAFWSTALRFDAEGLWAAQVNIWGDWTQHLGDVSSFVYGGNVQPEHPRFAGHFYPYHYLSAFTAALMVELGMQPATALMLHSFIFSMLITFGVYAFARRLSGSSPAAALAMVLFFLGGGLGWILTIRNVDSPQRIFWAIWQFPWDRVAQEAANFRWQNMFFSFISPQRGYLYGLPLALLILTLLLTGIETLQTRLFIAAGVVAALLPLAHLSTLLALALITPFLLLLFPTRRWALFFGVWIVLALPQLYFQQGGERGATAALRAQLGWVAAPDPWLWFWIKNLGWFLPFLVVALARRNLLSPVARRFLWAFMPTFMLANLLVFQPWDWDNAKVLLYWFLAVSILVATLLVKTWQRYSTPFARTIIATAVATMILSGLLLNLQQFLGKDRNLLLTNEELALAGAVRAQTSPTAIFVAGLQHNHPISVLSGRSVILGYTGPLWAQGLNYVQREQDVRAIYAFAPTTLELLSRYNVDYVVIGPYERLHLAANVAEFRARYRSVITTGSYEVFSVRGL